MSLKIFVGGPDEKRARALAAMITRALIKHEHLPVEGPEADMVETAAVFASPETKIAVTVVTGDELPKEVPASPAVIRATEDLTVGDVIEFGQAKGADARFDDPTTTLPFSRAVVWYRDPANVYLTRPYLVLHGDEHMGVSLCGVDRFSLPSSRHEKHPFCGRTNFIKEG